MSTADGRGPTDLRVEPLQMPAADLGPENPLPEFRRERDSDAYRVADGIPEEERRHIGWEIGRRVLPYRMQDGYGGDLRPRTFNAAILENGRLKAVFLPDLGGRLISLLHKPTGRELLEPVRAFRPANLALRNAWFSEWSGTPGSSGTTA
jgi:hypothetical protein